MRMCARRSRRPALPRCPASPRPVLPQLSEQCGSREGIRRDERSESEPPSGALESLSDAGATTQHCEISRERKRFPMRLTRPPVRAGNPRQHERSKPHPAAGTCTNARARYLAFADPPAPMPAASSPTTGCRRVGPAGACGPAHGSRRAEDRRAAAGAHRREQSRATTSHRSRFNLCPIRTRSVLRRKPKIRGWPTMPAILPSLSTWICSWSGCHSTWSSS